MPLLARCAIDHIVPLRQLVQQDGYLLGGVLQIIIERYDDLATRRANAGQKRIVLTKVAHQVNAVDKGVRLRQAANDLPAPIAAAVIDQDDLELPSRNRKHRAQPSDQL